MAVIFENFCKVALCILEQVPDRREGDSTCILIWKKHAVDIIKHAQHQYAISCGSTSQATWILLDKLEKVYTTVETPTLFSGPRQQCWQRTLDWLETDLSITPEKNPESTPPAEAMQSAVLQLAELKARRQKASFLLRSDPFNLGEFDGVVFPSEFVCMQERGKGNPNNHWIMKNRFSFSSSGFPWHGFTDYSLAHYCCSNKIALFKHERRVATQDVTFDFVPGLVTGFIKTTYEEIKSLVAQQETRLSPEQVLQYSGKIFAILLEYDKNPCLRAAQLILDALQQCNLSVLKIRDVKDGEGIFSIRLIHAKGAKSFLLQILYQVDFMCMQLPNPARVELIGVEKGSDKVATCYSSCRIDLNTMAITQPTCYIKTDNKKLFDALKVSQPLFAIDIPLRKAALDKLTASHKTADFMTQPSFKVRVGDELCWRAEDVHIAPKQILTFNGQKPSSESLSADYAICLSVGGESRPQCLIGGAIYPAIKQKYPEWMPWHQACLKSFVAKDSLNSITNLWARISTLFIDMHKLVLVIKAPEEALYKLTFCEGYFLLSGSHEITSLHDKSKLFSQPEKSCARDARMLTFEVIIRLPCQQLSPVIYDNPTLTLHPGCSKFQARILRVLSEPLKLNSAVLANVSDRLHKLKAFQA